MATACDVANTIELIRNFWPDLEFTDNDFKSGNVHFINRFFSLFVAEVNEKIAYLTNQEAVDDFSETTDTPQTSVAVLYRKVMKILKHMSFIKLDLIDFYLPNPKKMCPVLKFSIHFVVFLNNRLDNMFNVFDQVHKQVNEKNSLIALKQKILQENADNAEHLARLEEMNNNLKLQLNDMKVKHEKMLKDKSEFELDFSKKQKEKNQLQNEVDNLECKLQFLEEQEKQALESIVTVEEFETLKTKEQLLENNVNLFTEEDVSLTVDLKETERLEQIAKQLSSLNYDILDIHSLQQFADKVRTHEENLKKTKEFLNNLNNKNIEQKKNNEKLEKFLEQIQKLYLEFKNRIDLEDKKRSEICVQEAAKCAAAFANCKKTETEIELVKLEMEKLKEGVKNFCDFMAHTYQEILNADREATEKFNNMLEKLAYGEED